tara:strand:- start:1 stop:744 length:744 start_codon:yes stop_codon:yes gene_type:complete
MKIDNIIIGRSLTCLLYSWKTQTKCLIKDPEYVFKFNKRYEGYDLSFVNAKNANELWSNLCFVMSLSSLLLFPNNVASYRFDDNILNVITKGNRRVEIETSNLQEFDLETKYYGVYDFFDVKELSSHDIDRIEDHTDFVSQLDFYRFAGTTRGLVGSSRMTQEQLLDPDLGQGIAKLKALRMIKDRGLVGNFSREYNGKRYHKKPKIEFHKRVTTPLIQSQLTFDEVYRMPQVKGEAWKMIETLKTR